MCAKVVALQLEKMWNYLSINIYLFSTLLRFLPRSFKISQDKSRYKILVLVVLVVLKGKTRHACRKSF